MVHFLLSHINLNHPLIIFSLQVTSSWGLTSTYGFTVQKLAESAPTVSIVGNNEVGVSRNVPYYINSVGQASSCLNAKSALGYQWSYSNCSVNLANVPTLTNQNNLFMPAG
jgi:hypothetical protein